MTRRSTNLLLESLSARDLAAMLDATEPMLLPVRTVLSDSGVRPLYAYFITDGIASVVVNFAAGQMAEVGIIGREGLCGALHLLSERAPHTRCFMQVGGSGRRMPLTALESVFAGSREIRQRILEFVQLMTMHAEQLAACNALHSLEQRLARRLLLVDDRLQQEEYALTHECLAEMLLVQRPTLSLAASVLQRAGLIRYRYGSLRIVQRDELEKAACECYGVERGLLERLYARPPADGAKRRPAPSPIQAS